MLVLSVTGTRQQSHRLAADSPASTGTVLACLAACVCQALQSCSWARDVQDRDELQVRLSHSSSARLHGKCGCNEMPSQHFSEKPFAELCYMHAFFPARKEHCWATDFYVSLCVFSILLFPVVQHFLLYVLHLTDRSQPCTHRDNEDISVGYAVKWICSMGSWHLSHPLGLMAFFPLVDLRCITVPLNPVMWLLKHMV